MTAQAGDTSTLSDPDADAKKRLRRIVRARLAAMPPAARRRAATAAALHLSRTPLWRKTRRVAVYLTHRDELPTEPLLALLFGSGRAVYVPKIGTGGTMRFLRLRPGAALIENRYGILEPATRRAGSGRQRLDLVILPLVAFDARGHRLGAGGGYFDRAFARAQPHRRPALVGYAYAAQQVDRIPADPWDVRLDAAVTERGWLRLR